MAVSAPPAKQLQLVRIRPAAECGAPRLSCSPQRQWRRRARRPPMAAPGPRCRCRRLQRPPPMTTGSRAVQRAAARLLWLRHRLPGRRPPLRLLPRRRQPAVLPPHRQRPCSAVSAGVVADSAGVDAPGPPIEAGGEPNGGRVWRVSCGPLPIAPVAPTAEPATKCGTGAALPPPPSSTTATDDDGVTGGAASSGTTPMALPSADAPSPAASPAAWPPTAGSAAAPPVPAVMGGAGGGGGRRAGCGASGVPLVSLRGPRGAEAGDGALGAVCVPLSAPPAAATPPPAAAALATIAAAAARSSFFHCIVARRFWVAAFRFCLADVAREGRTGGWSLSPLVVLLVGSLGAMSKLESSESSFRSKNTSAASELLRASR